MHQKKAVVIGAGMGGLATAIRLRASGWTVCVIEQADAPGGKARALASAAGPIDTGPTVLTLPQHADALFRLCGTRLEDEVTLHPLPRLARHFWPDGTQLDLFADIEASAAAIEAFSSRKEAEAFRRFNTLSRNLYEAFEAPMMCSANPSLAEVARISLKRPALWPALAPGMTLERLLRRYFSDPRLVQLFARYATYVGGRPNHTPGVLALVWQAEAAGVWAVEEGIHGLAAALTRVAIAAGITFRFSTQATRILRQNNRVTGVELKDGRALRCDACVFNGDPQALNTPLLGQIEQKILPDKSKHKASLSAWVWAFAATPAGPELAHHNVFFTATPKAEFDPIGKGRMPDEPTLYICAQDRELGRDPPETERFEIIMNGPADYKPSQNEDEECKKRTFQTLQSFGLTFSPLPDKTALTTPGQLAQRFPGSLGAIYGTSPEGMMAPFKRPRARTLLKGLYLAGGGAHPGAGVPMALLSGQHAATALEEDLTSGSLSMPADTHGGISMASPRTERVPSQSSAS